MDLDQTIVLEFPEERKFNICPVCGAEMKFSPDGKNTLRCPVCNYLKKSRSIIEPGNVVINKYRILSKLAHGAFGDIYLCYPLDNVAERYVLKQLRTGSGNSCHRFRREAEMMASIGNDDRIVQIVDFWEEDDSMFIIMEYIRGMNLRQAKQEYVFDEISAWQIAVEMVLALSYIWNEYSLIHRDIKPENIMLDEDFRLKILDFGLCKQCGSDSVVGLTIANATLGTPGYMSPEQFVDSKHVDFRSDIFSLGATIYFLLTGENPFSAADLDQVYEKTLQNSPPPAESLQSVCSDSGIAIIQKMMMRKPQDRYSSYMELQEDIEKQLAALGVE